jgi:signal transduction histidine kinase
MATAIADFQATSSRTTASKAGIDNANIGSKGYCLIYPYVGISISHPRATAMVIQPFVVELTPREGGYMATSDISNAYELGATAGQALRNYLEFLVDELIWLQNHEEDLSSSIHEDLRLLQSYLRIV